LPHQCANCSHKFKQGEERVIDLQDEREYCENCRSPDGLTTMTIGQARAHYRLREQDKEVKHYRPSLRHDKEWQQEQIEKKRAQKVKDKRSFKDKFLSFNLQSQRRDISVKKSHGTMPAEGNDPRPAERTLKRIRPNYDATDKEIADWYDR
tara:strand:+ start:302 stop:754 length:453 start_codon:yes stop_codon:yes gene_type:complete